MKDKPGYSKHLLLEVDNQFINFLQQIILWSVKALALLWSLLLSGAPLMSAWSL